ncbi:MAG: Rieske (2Fe-2S) protein [Pseudomonadales bacterium]|nr:Rieske (2Fe-2S) protein [Pseudomonadales bacterium]MCP5185977.1 Rieske (2Fe-2S) protein [Pseudomonadales bacterium]
MSGYRAIARVEQVRRNGSLAVEIDGLALLVCNADDVIHVIVNRCSHQDQPLAGGRIRNGFIFCPFHGMRYRLATGEGVGQLTRLPIRVLASRVVDGEVQACLPADGALQPLT